MITPARPLQVSQVVATALLKIAARLSPRVTSVRLEGCDKQVGHWPATAMAAHSTPQNLLPPPSCTNPL